MFAMSESCRVWVLAVAVAAGGCVGGVPAPEQPDAPDADVDPGPFADASPSADPDAAPDPTGIRVSGTVRDYFNNTALQAAALSTDGLAPALSATSDAAGSYALTEVPPASAFYVRATMPTGYRATINEPTIVTDVSVARDQYVMSMVDAQRQHTTVGVAVEATTAIIAANLLAPDDTPMEAVLLADITLTDSLGTAVGAGPYILGTVGDIDVALTETAAFGGRSRVAFLNVPANTTVTLTATYEATAYTATFTTATDGAHLVRVGGTVPGITPAAPSFTDDIYPVLQTAAKGGAGCANCHTLGGTMPTLRFDDPAATVHAAILAGAGIIDTAAPELSLMLTNPLYEDPPDHPNATWLDVADPSYQTLYVWIGQGAAL